MQSFSIAFLHHLTGNSLNRVLILLSNQHISLFENGRPQRNNSNRKFLIKKTFYFNLQDEQYAKSCPIIQLPCLRCDLFNYNQWISKANALIQLCDCLINSPSTVFWSSAALRSEILKELDYALENLPFLSDIQEKGVFMNAEIGPQVTELFAKLLVMFFRLAVNNESEVYFSKNNKFKVML